MAVAFYPGCSHHALAEEYDRSARTICAHLQLELKEVEDWNCCGATAAHSLSPDLSLALNMRNLSQVKKMGLDEVITPCSGCFNRLKVAAHEIEHHPAALQNFAAMAQCELPSQVNVRHLLQFILEQYPSQQIESLVKKPLRGLKLAAYYGCLLTRPAAVVQFDDPEQPVALDGLMRSLGAQTVTWSHKAECCGGGFSASEPGIAGDLGGQILASAKDAGAEAIVAACPLCQMNLDSRQALGCDLPIVYFTQLMGLAFGYGWNEMRFSKLLTSPKPLLSRLGLL
ncbi:MAG: CoB--CoM heterodisulfide reductase iron-sulfur subunit B family protein [Desulfovibrionaceae bacterium]|nr:CoB--CoM heterodisulfide reductase iron-sulfur subunit B family protein [Desulfovibrionaceae bacterium]